MTATDALSVPGEIPTGEGPWGLHPARPAEVVAAIPSLLGFRPSPGDLVVLGSFEDPPPTGPKRVLLRYDLPRWPNPIMWHTVTHNAAALLGAQHYDVMTVVGYGPDELVSPLLSVLRHAAGTHNVRLAEFLRVRDGRYWSCLCDDPDCCSPRGTVFEETCESAILLPDGNRVLASRDVLVATLAPATGESAQSMHAATARALDRTARMTRRAAACQGLEAIADAITRYEKNDRELTCDDAARITVALASPRVRDDAWHRISPGQRTAHMRLWTDLTRLARPGRIAAPATLLAFTAWQSGNGTLASIALDRALADDPRYRLALALRRVIDSGLSWRRAQRLMTPELPASRRENNADRPAG